MRENLVTVVTFFNPQDFLMARMRLEAAGIACFTLGENLFQITGGAFNPIVAGVKLQVASSDEQDARAILGEAPRPFIIQQPE
jgi:hypothetical protein